MTALLRVIDSVCTAGAAVAGVLLLLLFGLGLTEIVLRSFFSISLSIAVEYTGYLLILVLFLGSGWTMRQGGHIRVTILSERLPIDHRRWLDIFCTAIGLCLAAYMSMSILTFAYGTWVRGTVSYFSSETPLAYPQFLLATGPSLLVLALLARLIRLWQNEKAERDDIQTSTHENL